jgi:flagellar protein FlbT
MSPDAHPEITVPLKITLKPREIILLGGALLKNGEHLAQFTIENEVPILRQKDILTERQADTICKKIYFVIQLMYFEPGNLASHHKTFWELVRILSAAVPSTLPLIDEIGELILEDRYYQALKATRKLIAYEEVLVRKANESPQDLHQNPEGNPVGSRR